MLVLFVAILEIKVEVGGLYNLKNREAGLTEISPAPNRNNHLLL